MAIPEFTLTAGPEGFSRVMGGVSMTAESLEGLEVTLTPNIMGGQFLLVDGGQRFIDSVTVTLDADGKINGDTGIKLLANDDALDLEKPIQWTISFDKDFRFDGFKRQFSKWSFIAPDNGETKGLHELSHVTGLSATNVTRGPRGFGIDLVTRVGNTLKSWVQGTQVGSVDISDLVFNGTMDSLTDATAVGKAVGRAASQAAGRAAINAEVAGAPKTMNDITDATTVGKAVARATDAPTARGAINAQALLPAGYFTSVGKADGAIGNLDSGQAWSAFGNTPGSIVSGAVVHTPVGSSASTAAYYQVLTTSRPTRIVCEGRWTNNNGNDNASLTFVVPISPWGPQGGFPADNPAQVVAGIHSSFYRNGIHKHSRWNVGTQTVYGDSEAAVGSVPALGRYPVVPVGKTVRFEMWIDYTLGTLTFIPPSGPAMTVQNDAIKNDTGNVLVIEQFEFNGTAAGAPFVIERMDFDTQVRNKSSFAVTKPDISEAIEATKRVVYEFTSPGSTGTFGVPPGTIEAVIDMIAPGAGGGSGRRGAAGTLRTGGSSGGSGGAILGMRIPVAELGSTWGGSLGAVGVGGAAVTTDSTDGNNGTTGGYTSFVSGSTTVQVVNAGAGQKGTSTGAAAAGAAGAPLGTAGAASSATGGAGTNGSVQTNGNCGMSGAGGGITTGDVPGNGGNGTSNYLRSTGAATAGGRGGVVGGATPTSGAAAQRARPGDGVGGGAASITGAAQAGADGVGYGAGGGGGGASLNGNVSGKGGNGGPPYMRVTFVIV